MIALLVVAIATFNLERIIGLTQRHIHAVALVKDAPGVRIGTDVWVEGVKVGRVETVEITKWNDSVFVVLDMRLERRVRDVVTASSDVRAARRRLIGEPVVRIYAGSPADPPLQPGDTIVGRPRIQPEDLLAMGEALPPALDSLLRATRTVQADFERRGPEIERLIAQLANTSGALASFAEILEAGSIGPMLDASTGLPARMAALRARFEELNRAATRLVDRYSGDVDGGLVMQLEGLSGRVARVEMALAGLQARLDHGEGIIARARQDTAIQVAIRGVQAQMDSLVAEAHSIALRMFLPQ